MIYNILCIVYPVTRIIKNMRYILLYAIIYYIMTYNNI